MQILFNAGRSTSRQPGAHLLDETLETDSISMYEKCDARTGTQNLEKAAPVGSCEDICYKEGAIWDNLPGPGYVVSPIDHVT